MERKTIGKFISALRRAKGLTQRELGDMLYVSDKAVSRWENDECTPDLNLLPAIADIFGVTCDELLRGERRPQNGEPPSDETAPPTEKSKRRLQAILHKKYSAFRNLSFISFGLALSGLIAAIICVLCGKEDNVTWLGFLLPAFLTVAAAACETLFTFNGTAVPDEQPEEHAKLVCAHNANVMRLAVAAVMADAFVFGLCLPFIGAPYSHTVDIYQTEALFMPGTGIGCMLALAAYGIYFKTVRARMIGKGTLKFSDEQAANAAADNKLLLKISLVSGTIYILLVIFSLIAQAHPDMFYFQSGSSVADYSASAVFASYALMPMVCAAGAIVYFCIKNSRKKIKN